MPDKQSQWRPTNTDDGPNIIETWVVSSNEQFSSLGKQEKVMGADQDCMGGKLILQRKCYTVHDEVHNFPEIKSWAAAKWLK